MGAPELIIEVSHTTGARDTGAKLKLYERSGVCEYIIVRPKTERVTWHQLADRQYHEITPGADGCFRSHVFPGLWLDSKALRKPDLQALAAAVAEGTATPEHSQFVKRLARNNPR